MQLEGDTGMKAEKLLPIDAWMLSKLQTLIQRATESFDIYEYSKARQDVDAFFWHAFCDNYLEIIKDRVYNKDTYTKAEVLSAQYTLYHSSLTLLKLFAPLLPHITEEVYHFFYAAIEKIPSIHRSSWPECNPALVNQKAERAGDLLVAIIAAVRRYKSEQQVSLKAGIRSLSIAGSAEQKKLLQELERDLKAVTHAQNVIFVKPDSLALTTQDKKESLDAAHGKEFIILDDYKLHIKIELNPEEKVE